MAPGSKKKKKGVKGSPVDKLTDDILADIISRVPYKSSRCCKCVSTRWRDLFSHPDHRKKMPQSIAGFFYEDCNEDRFPEKARYFINVTGKGYRLIDPSLSFLPKCERLDIMDCCNGLLLCRCWKDTDPETVDYVVCNPATMKWVVVPATEWSSKVNVARLGFDSAVSAHYHVFEFISQEVWGLDESELSYYGGRIEAVATYSSKAGVWTHKMVKYNDFAIPAHSKGVFFNGVMHLAAYDDMVVTFDVKGKLLRIIRTPSPPCRYDFPVNDVFLSQGQLHFTCSTNSESDDSISKRSDESDSSNLLVWVLEDYSSEKWTLKHTVSHLQLFEDTDSEYPDYNVISFHPERNMIFIVYGHNNTLISYEMDCKKRCSLRQLGQDGHEYFGEINKNPFIPYVPLFTESLADGPRKPI
ncbi:putative F-box protein At3g22650 [Lolium rigidum]|uniref:putative F-box protein At3g22650 n=1 Tax=Lolium rigidum TaxID=89674 RepID=UPI001F5C2DCA|nr:putative F-box protein At3g22650 [Lolium rigidum]